jgi:hypothetical protein
VDPAADRPNPASPSAVARIARTVACPLAAVLLVGVPRPADALLPPPPVRLPVLHGADGWAPSPAAMRILSDRAAAEVRIVPVPEWWKA